MADENLMEQADLERLLDEAKGASASDAPADAPASQSSDADQASPAAAGKDAASLDPDDIEKLLAQATGDSPDEPAPPTEKPSAHVTIDEGSVPQGDVDCLLKQAEAALESVNSAAGDLPQGAAPYRLSEFSGAPASSETATLDLIRDVELDLRIELGRTHLQLENVLKLRKGSVVPLDKMAGDPVDVYVNGRLIARGEVLVLNDNFCVRVTELMAGTKVPA